MTYNNVDVEAMSSSDMGFNKCLTMASARVDWSLLDAVAASPGRVLDRLSLTVAG
jgi:hypothetical protein